MKYFTNYALRPQKNYLELDLSSLSIKNFHEDQKQWESIPELKFNL